MLEADFAFYRSLRAQDILQEVKPDRLAGINELQLIGCSDGHRARDAFGFLSNRIFATSECIHPGMVNGGPLALCRQCTFSRQSRGGIVIPVDLFLLNQIEGAIKLRKGVTVVLQGHWPCGLAGMYDYSLRDCLGFLREAKLRIRQEINPVKEIVCLVQMDLLGYGNDEFKTYRFDASHFTSENIEVA